MINTPRAVRAPSQIWDCGRAGHRHLAKAEAMRCIEGDAADGPQGSTAAVSEGGLPTGPTRNEAPPLLPRLQQVVAELSDVLDALVEDKLVEVEARRVGITVSDDALARAIATDPRFQREGRYMGSSEIKRLLQVQGMTETEFEKGERQRLLRETLEGLVTDAVTVSDAEVEQEFRRRNEQVKAEYVLADAARYRPQVSVSDEDVKAAERTRVEFSDQHLLVNLSGRGDKDIGTVADLSGARFYCRPSCRPDAKGQSVEVER